MSDISRVTQQSATMLMVADLQSSLGSLTVYQEETATGKAINQPSDNPSGTSQVLALNAQLGRFTQYTSNISDGQSWLNTADDALGSAVKALNQVQTDVLSGANASASDPAANQALAQEVVAIKQQLLGLSATSYNSRPIFSGTYGTNPYPQSGATPPNYTYAGSTTAVSRVIAPGQSVSVSLTGNQVFGSGAGSVFALLDTISSDLTSGNTSALSGADLTQLQTAMDTVTQSQGDVGALGAGLATKQLQVSDTMTALTSRVATISDADEAQVASELVLATTSYQAALETTAKIIQPSLVQFLS